ncbi:MAG: tetratricopeptide repeat protein [Terracidiphilus sp.]
MKRTLFIFALTVLSAAALGTMMAVDGRAAASQPVAIVIDYPLQGSIFPPEITPPTFIWHDAARSVANWRINIAFADGSPAIHAQSKGEALKIGEIDPRCISSTNELPKLTPEQASAHTWIPDSITWSAIKKHSAAGAATVSITGLRGNDAVSLGQVTITTSKDPLGAPIFYRDVPLMPSQTEKGVIKPLDSSAIPLIKWRLRDVAQPSSRVVLEGIHTCANCHSFSRDGKTLGMDMDGPHNDKGLYALVPIKPEIVIRNQDMVSWNPAQDLQYKLNRVAFMSQVSPDGQYIVNTVSGADHIATNNYYVANFKDYRFLQVFYPTRGLLGWYSRASKERHLLPGADDPNYVQTDAVWSPDGKYLVFARAQARPPYPEDGKMAKFANDPAEVQVQYDLYRIPFNDGKGGTPEPIEGASNNGMSNNFPKVSPDGRWIVFVKNKNGQLMRPDSELYIVPAEGGVARRLQANTWRMNSWHSFSPNGRWLVFSSKARSFYTQMYLTHIDEDGNSSPAILIDNSTAANRAVNIPEFVNIKPDGLLKINTPVLDMYRRFDQAAMDGSSGKDALAIAEWEALVKEEPNDETIQNNLGAALVRVGRFKEAIPYYQKGLEINPQYYLLHNNLGMALAAMGRVDDAIQEYEKGLEINPDFAELHNNLGQALAQTGQLEEAARHFERAVNIKPEYAEAHVNLGIALLSSGQLDQAANEFRSAVDSNPRSVMAHTYLGSTLYYGQGKVPEALVQWRKALKLNPNNVSALNQMAHALSACPTASERNGAEAVRLAEHAVELSKGEDPASLDTLAMALAESGRFAEAAQTAQHALQLARAQNQSSLAEDLNARINLYQSKKPYRDDLQPAQ